MAAQRRDRRDEFAAQDNDVLARRVGMRDSPRMAGGLLAAFFLLASPAESQETPQRHETHQRDERRSYLEELDSMPDFCQVDPALGATPSEGARWCGPAAVSNALVWLDQHGYLELIREEPITPEAHAVLVRELASDAFMSSDDGGTEPKQIVAGLEKFFAARGYGVKIETMGWRSRARRIGRVPDVEWFLRSAHADSNVVLNVGGYTHDPNTKTYQRHDGHYVTVAGYERQEARVTIYVHDPAGRDGLQRRTVRCELCALQAGARLRLGDGGTIDAAAFLELKGIRIKPRNDLAIIDGAIAFRPVRIPQADEGDGR